MFRKYKEKTVNKFLIAIISFCALFTIISMFISYRFSKIERTMTQMEQDNIYEYYYVMIVNDVKSPFWLSVYESALAEAKEHNAYLELIGTNLPINYSVQQLMQIAIDEKVDGILLEPTKEEEMSAMIDLAVEKGIPVITMMEDCPQSKRQCYIGVSNYNLGQEYVNQIRKILTDDVESILVLLPGNTEDGSKNLIFSSIKELAEEQNVQVESLSIQSISNFSTEETVRNIVLNKEELPDILICLNYVQTESAYQAIVNYNKVGEIKIIGYFETETILQAIDKNIIQATLAVDTVKLGKLSIESMYEYITTSRVSDYRAVDITIIDQTNIEEFLLQSEEGDK